MQHASKVLDLSDTLSTTSSTEELPMDRHTLEMPQQSVYPRRVVTDKLVSCNDKHTHQPNITERAVELIPSFSNWVSFSAVTVICI